VAHEADEVLLTAAFGAREDGEQWSRRRDASKGLRLSASSLLLGRHAGTGGHCPHGRWHPGPGAHQQNQFEDVTGSDTKGQGDRIRFEKTRPCGDYTEDHVPKRIELEVDDAQAKLLRAASDRGEPIYVRFSDENDVQTHVYRVKF
jgi:hypothetical protein